jgi:hypothetical protein
MKNPFENGTPHDGATRRRWMGRISLCLVAGFAAIAKDETFSTISFYAKRVGSGAAWHWHCDQRRGASPGILTEVEYLFFPESGAGARMSLKSDD